MKMYIAGLAYNVYGYVLRCLEIEDITAIDSGHGINITVVISGKYKFETSTLFNNIIIMNMITNRKIVLSSDSFESVIII